MATHYKIWYNSTFPLNPHQKPRKNVLKLKYDKEIFWESLSFIGLHSYKIIWSQGFIPKISGLLKDEKDQPSTNNCYGWLISIYYSTFLYV